MSHDLEAPCDEEEADWSRLYRARGAEVSAHRPYFTGDVFEEVLVESTDGRVKRKDVLIAEATSECVDWLRKDEGGPTRQRLLDDPQCRSTVRMQMRQILRSM